MRSIFAMQVEVVRGPVIGFKDSKVFLVEMRINLMPGMQGEQEGVISVIGIEDKHGAQIEGPVAGHRGQVGVEQVVIFFDRAGHHGC